MTDRTGPRRELERASETDGPGAEQAKIALTAESVPERLRAAILALAFKRGPQSSTCPSDAARAVADDWRPLLPQAQELARELARDGEVRLTQGDQVLDPDGEWRGPIRIRRAEERYLVINGRRWRATDPEIPEEAAAQLRSHLMRARRDVGAAQDKAAEQDARARVHTAKIALGERGTPWWEQDSAERRQRWQDGLDALG